MKYTGMHYIKRSAYRELHHCTIFLIDLPKIELYKTQEQRKEKSRYDVENIQQIIEEMGEMIWKELQKLEENYNIYKEQ